VRPLPADVLKHVFRPGRPGSRHLRAAAPAELPEHGVVVEAVPFAWHKSGSLVTSRTWSPGCHEDGPAAVARLVRVNWRTVGDLARVVADELDPRRLNGLYDIGVNEIWLPQRPQLPDVVANHDSGKLVWADEAKTPPLSTGSSPSSAVTGPNS
jgi:transposase